MSSPQAQATDLLKSVADAEAHLRAANIQLESSLSILRAEGFGNSDTARALSIALTHAQTAQLWLSCAQVFSGRP